MSTGAESYRDVDPEEDESTASSESHRPQHQPDLVQWTVPGAHVRKRKRKTNHLERFLESYMQQKRRLDEVDQNRRDEEKAVFEDLIKMQQEAEERRFKAVMEVQRANSQLLLHMMGTLVRALLPHPDTPPAERLPPTLTVSPIVQHPSDTRATTAEPQPPASPQEVSERPLAAMAASLPQTNSSLLHGANTQVFDRNHLKLLVTCRHSG